MSGYNRSSPPDEKSMRSSPISVLCCLIASACVSAQVDLSSDGEIESAEGDTGDQGLPDSESDPTENENPEEEEEEEGPSYTGSYSGYFQFEIYSDYWDFELEDCETLISVTGEGGLSGDSTCLYDGGWGDPYEQVFEIEGEVRSDGEVSGTIIFELEWGDAVDLDLSGSISDDLDMELASEGEYESDWSTLMVYGEGDLRTSD